MRNMPHQATATILPRRRRQYLPGLLRHRARENGLLSFGLPVPSRVPPPGTRPASLTRARIRTRTSRSVKSSSPAAKRFWYSPQAVSRRLL